MLMFFNIDQRVGILRRSLETQNFYLEISKNPSLDLFTIHLINDTCLDFNPKNYLKLIEEKL